MLRFVAATTRTSVLISCVPADAIETPRLQHAQQARLHLHRHLGDFIQQQRAAGCALEDACVRARGARKTAFLVAEQLGLDERSRNRSAVDRDERPLSAMAQQVNAFGDELFAHTAFAHDHHRRLGWRDALNEREQLAHCR